MVYSPASLVVAVRDTFVDRLTMVTEAPGTMAPELSCTTPVMVPRSDCASAVKANSEMQTARKGHSLTWRRYMVLSFEVDPGSSSLHPELGLVYTRSEERRVGKEC